MQLRDLCEIHTAGGNPYPFINAVRQSSVICMAQHCEGGAFCCTIRQSDLPLLQEIAGRCGMELICRRPRSVQGFLRRYRLRWGLVIGFVAAAALILWQSNVVATVEVQGNTTVSTKAILTVLAREGLTRGAWIPGVDMGHCEHEVRMSLPGIAWCGIRHTGNRLVVEVAEETPCVPMLQSRSPCNIVAAENAQITGIRVQHGELMRMMGDGVAKGDLLVSGIYEDQRGFATFHHAMAEITGIYTKEAELTCYFEQVQTHPTGERRTEHTLCFCGMELPLQLYTKAFASERRTESETPLCFLGLRLPVSLRTATIEALDSTVTHLTPEEAQLSLQSDIVRYEQNLLTDVTILDRQMTFTQSEDCLTCHLIYTVEGEIGKEADFMVQ